MLVCLTVGGAAVGLLGKLYFTNPDLGAFVVSFLTTIVPFVLATGTLIRIGWRSKQRLLSIWGTILLVTPLIGAVLMFAMQMYARPNSRGRGLMSNKALIQRELPKNITDYTLWEELKYRAENGKLSTQEVDQVVSGFVEYAKRKRPKGWDQPLHNQDDFFESVRASDLISKNSLIDMCDAYFGPPRLKPYKAGSGRQRIEIEYGTVWDNDSHHGLGVAHLWAVKEVLLDGKSLELRHKSQNSNGWYGQPTEPIPADAKQLSVKLEVAYIDSSKMIGLDADRLPLDRWPKAIKRWTTTIKIPLDGTDPFKAPLPTINLTSDPKKKPAPPKVERVVVQLDANDFRTIVVRFGNPVKPPVAISFDVFAQVDGDKLPVGNYYVIPSENGVSYTGTELVSHGHAIESDAESANLLFVPNVEAMQKALMNSHDAEHESIKEIWGKPFTLRGIELERLDLEVGGSSE